MLLNYLALLVLPSLINIMTADYIFNLRLGELNIQNSFAQFCPQHHNSSFGQRSRDAEVFGNCGCGVDLRVSFDGRTILEHGFNKAQHNCRPHINFDNWTRGKLNSTNKSRELVLLGTDRQNINSTENMNGFGEFDKSSTNFVTNMSLLLETSVSSFGIVCLEYIVSLTNVQERNAATNPAHCMINKYGGPYNWSCKRKQTGCFSVQLSLPQNDSTSRVGSLPGAANWKTAYIPPEARPQDIQNQPNEHNISESAADKLQSFKRSTNLSSDYFLIHYNIACPEFYFGAFCQRRCRSAEYDHYECSQSGLKLCDVDYYNANCTTHCVRNSTHGCNKQTGAPMLHPKIDRRGIFSGNSTSVDGVTWLSNTTKLVIGCIALIVILTLFAVMLCCLLVYFIRRREAYQKTLRPESVLLSRTQFPRNSNWDTLLRAHLYSSQLASSDFGSDTSRRNSSLRSADWDLNDRIEFADERKGSMGLSGTREWCSGIKRTSAISDTDSINLDVARSRTKNYYEVPNIGEWKSQRWMDSIEVNDIPKFDRATADDDYFNNTTRLAQPKTRIRRLSEHFVKLFRPNDAVDMDKLRESLVPKQRFSDSYLINADKAEHFKRFGQFAAASRAMSNARPGSLRVPVAAKSRRHTWNPPGVQDGSMRECFTIVEYDEIPTDSFNDGEDTNLRIQSPVKRGNDESPTQKRRPQKSSLSAQVFRAFENLNGSPSEDIGANPTADNLPEIPTTTKAQISIGVPAIRYREKNNRGITAASPESDQLEPEPGESGTYRKYFEPSPAGYETAARNGQMGNMAASDGKNGNLAQRNGKCHPTRQLCRLKSLPELRSDWRKRHYIALARRSTSFRHFWAEFVETV